MTVGSKTLLQQNCPLNWGCWITHKWPLNSSLYRFSDGSICNSLVVVVSELLRSFRLRHMNYLFLSENCTGYNFQVYFTCLYLMRTTIITAVQVQTVQHPCLQC